MGTLQNLQEKGYVFFQTEQLSKEPVEGKKIFWLECSFQGGPRKSVVMVKEPINFCCGLSVASQAEADALAKAGHIIKVSGREIYREYYSLTDDEYSKFFNGYGTRTASYLDAICSKIGLLRYTDASNGSMSPEGEPTKFEVIRRYSHFVNSGDTEIGKLDNGEYIAQLCFQIEIDDFAVVKAYWDHLPSDKQLRTFFKLRTIKDNFLFRRAQEVYTCWECGKKTHWLDSGDSFDEKITGLEERYCGC
jgi:hypothetical protein